MFLLCSGEGVGVKGWVAGVSLACEWWRGVMGGDASAGVVVVPRSSLTVCPNEAAESSPTSLGTLENVDGQGRGGPYRTEPRTRRALDIMLLPRFQARAPRNTSGSGTVSFQFAGNKIDGLPTPERLALHVLVVVPQASLELAFD